MLSGTTCLATSGKSNSLPQISSTEITEVISGQAKIDVANGKKATFSEVSIFAENQ